MKKKLIALLTGACLAVSMCATALVACSDNSVGPEGAGSQTEQEQEVPKTPYVMFDKASVRLAAGATAKLRIAKNVAGSVTVSYTVDNTDVITIDNTSGNSTTVTAVSAGTATVTAKMTVDDVEYTDVCTVTVVAAVAAPTPSISIDKEALSLSVGEESKLTMTSENASSPAYIYSSDKPAVAIVDNTGNVTAKAEGTATITVKATINGTEYTKTCAVTVSAAAAAKPTISLDKKSVWLEVDETDTVNASAANATGAAVSYASSDATVVEVNATTGALTAKKEGAVWITAGITVDGVTYSDTCKVIVSAKLGTPYLRMGNETLALDVYSNATSKLEATPKNADKDTPVAFASSNADVATVDPDTGVITAVGSGTANITASMVVKGQTYSGSCAVTVTAVVPTISIQETASLDVGGTVTPTVDKNVEVPVTFESSDTTVATVDETTGEVTAIAPGTATITAKITANKTDYTDTCTVTVATPELSYAVKTVNAYVGSSASNALTAQHLGNLSVTYSSSNTSAATVNAATGDISLVSYGTTVITAKVNVGGQEYSDTYTLNVSYKDFCFSFNGSSVVGENNGWGFYEDSFKTLELAEGANSGTIVYFFYFKKGESLAAYSGVGTQQSAGTWVELSASNFTLCSGLDFTDSHCLTTTASGVYKITVTANNDGTFAYVAATSNETEAGSDLINYNVSYEKSVVYFVTPSWGSGYNTHDNVVATPVGSAGGWTASFTQDIAADANLQFVVENYEHSSDATPAGIVYTVQMKQLTGFGKLVDNDSHIKDGKDHWQFKDAGNYTVTLAYDGDNYTLTVVRNGDLINPPTLPTYTTAKCGIGGQGDSLSWTPTATEATNNNDGTWTWSVSNLTLSAGTKFQVVVGFDDNDLSWYGPKSTGVFEFANGADNYISQETEGKKENYQVKSNVTSVTITITVTGNYDGTGLSISVDVTSTT